MSGQRKHSYIDLLVLHHKNDVYNNYSSLLELMKDLVEVLMK
jgi:hypothetical protein